MKQMVWMGMIIGSVIGGLITSIWGAGMLSFSSILLSGLGAIGGIYVAYRMTH